MSSADGTVFASPLAVNERPWSLSLAVGGDTVMVKAVSSILPPPPLLPVVGGERSVTAALRRSAEGATADTAAVAGGSGRADGSDGGGVDGRWPVFALKGVADGDGL